jgi:glycosyltransferase involved in cell wall biosynthesis
MKNISPRISVIMPCLNEEKRLAEAVNSLIDDYFLMNCELLIVDGMSSDRTKEIAHSFEEKGLPVRLLENKKRTKSHGLNLGVTEAQGEIIVIADAHSLYPQDYIKNCVHLLEEGKGSNVGGIMLPEGHHTVQKAIAAAMKHPIGVGDAKWHLGRFTGYADTVYLGTFWKKIFQEVGLYDTSMKTNIDSELNLRILKSGEKIYLDSSIQVIYFPRESLGELAKQYFRYGQGRYYTTRKHKMITSARQIAPTALVLGLLTAVILSLWIPIFVLFPLAYVMTLSLASLFSWPKQQISLKQRILTAAAWGTMHLSWGCGFLFQSLRGRKI